MEFDPDVAYVVVEFLTKSRRPVTQAEVFDEVPFSRRYVTGVLVALTACGFVSRQQSKTSGKDDDVFLEITKTVSAYQIIKLGEIGLSLSSLCDLVPISEKQKQAALSLAMQTEKLAEMDEDLRAKRASELAKSSQVPLPRDSIVDTLERLALASEMSIKEMRGQKVGPEVLKALADAKEQALKALVEYQTNMGKGGPEHSGY